MARTVRKTKKQPEQLHLDLVGAIGRTKFAVPHGWTAGEELAFRDYSQRIYEREQAAKQARRS